LARPHGRGSPAGFPRQRHQKDRAMSDRREELRQLNLRISVLLARSRETRARADRLLERGRSLRERCHDHHEDISGLVARCKRLTGDPFPLRAAEGGRSADGTAEAGGASARGPAPHGGGGA
jgi:hypothetical protein